ncbi:flagellar biosynthesis protein FlhB [Campylobacter sp. RM13119]|uniref:flagellar biosynthesis protein FlhB n=1 Tax=Campylobacter TaxID=194 RepID=UPI0014737F5E|nr:MULTISPECIES: flagellar biosynthesis protein FlhB [unclassified Campylobacter]MBE3021811.1 flagellar biosynthesis protein FlhB [Campylobacter sp. 7477a]MBE3606161.1 flagellar biosynthesis protein FlhB [Campylobacter sp. RM13119]
MAGEDEEKTEEATSKKIEDAKKDGNVPKSQDISGFATLLVAITMLIVMLGFMKDQLVSLYMYYQSFIGKELTVSAIHMIAINTLGRALLMILPICVCVGIVGIIAYVMQFGLIFTTKPITPDLNKINPIKGLKNLFSLKKLIDGIKIVAKVSAVFGVGFYFFLQFIKELPHTLFLSMFDQLAWLKEKMIILVGVMLLILFIIGLIDLLIVRFQYFKDLRMSKQEIKDEYKQMEGDPQVKGRIRRLQMQTARKRMMQNVPQADVVITNPTHYAVAIRYDKSRDAAPVILAKGVDVIAMQIRKIALENSVQIIENPPLARELYKLCEVNDMIPETLFRAVAEVLSFVYMSDKKKFAGRI